MLGRFWGGRAGLRGDGCTQCRGAGAGRDRLRHELRRHARPRNGGAVLRTGAHDAGTVTITNVRAADGGTYSITLGQTDDGGPLGQTDGGALIHTNARPEPLEAARERRCCG